MIITIVIFFIAIILAFGMLTFRAWEIRTLRIVPTTEPVTPELSFRQMEKTMLYLTKHMVQGTVLVIVKYWFIATTKAKKSIEDKWPRIIRLLEKKSVEAKKPIRPSFVQRAVLESKIKIKRIKEKVKRENE